MESLLSGGAGIFKKIIDSMKEMVTDVNLNVSPSGFSLQAMDSSHVALISLNLISESFDNYKCEVNQTLGINLVSLQKIFKCCHLSDNVVFRSEHPPEMLQIDFEALNQSQIARFELKLIDIDAENLGIPDIDYNATVVMPSSKFRQICGNLSEIGDTARIIVDKETISFCIEGDDKKATIALKKNSNSFSESFNEKEKENEKVGSIDIKLNDLKEGQISQVFALKYLKFFCKGGSLCDVVTLKMGLERPLEVAYKIIMQKEGDAKSVTIGIIKYYLAPKIEDEKENTESVESNQPIEKENEKEKENSGSVKTNKSNQNPKTQTEKSTEKSNSNDKSTKQSGEKSKEKPKSNKKPKLESREKSNESNQDQNERDEDQNEQNEEGENEEIRNAMEAQNESENVILPTLENVNSQSNKSDSKKRKSTE